MWVLKMILVFIQKCLLVQTDFMIGLTQEPFDTNDEGRRDGQSKIYRCYHI